MKKFVCMSLLLWMIFPVFGFYAYGQGYTITRLTDNNYVDGSPNINNHGQVVWSGFDGHDYEIFLYDGVQIIQLTNNEYLDFIPDINDKGQVVWVASDNQDEVILFDGGGVSQGVISNDSYRKYWLAINNNGQVVWEAFDDYDYEIFLYDGTNIIQLTDNERNDRRPHINDNGQVVWESEIGNNEIFIANPN